MEPVAGTKFLTYKTLFKKFVGFRFWKLLTQKELIESYENK